MARRSRAAGTIQRAWRAKRRSTVARRSRIGTPVYGPGNCKSNVAFDLDLTTVLTGTLYKFDCTQSTQGNEINQRERGIINCRGFKFYGHFQNTSGALGLYLNVAMICPKSTNTTGGDAVSDLGFFRANGIVRAQDFGPAQTPFRAHVLNINPDDYTVLWHKRKLLAPNNGNASTWGSNARNGDYIMTKYTKINRRITYQNPESSAATDGRVWLVFWAGSTAAAETIQPAYARSIRCIMYFKEPKQ